MSKSQRDLSVSADDNDRDDQHICMRRSWVWTGGSNSINKAKLNRTGLYNLALFIEGLLQWQTQGPALKRATAATEKCILTRRNPEQDQVYTVDLDRLLVEADWLSRRQYLFPVGCCGLLEQLLSCSCALPHQWIHFEFSCYPNILLVNGMTV